MTNLTQMEDKERGAGLKVDRCKGATASGEMEGRRYEGGADQRRGATVGGGVGSLPDLVKKISRVLVKQSKRRKKCIQVK